MLAKADESDLAFVDLGAIDRYGPVNSMPLGISTAASTSRYDQYHE